jgi:hypothetical protein
MTKLAEDAARALRERGAWHCRMTFRCVSIGGPNYPQ